MNHRVLQPLLGPPRRRNSNSGADGCARSAVIVGSRGSSMSCGSSVQLNTQLDTEEMVQQLEEQVCVCVSMCLFA